MGVSGRSKVRPPGKHESGLEVESQFGREGARRDEVGPAECGEEVVKGNFVGHVDDCEAQAPPVIVFGAEQVVISDAGVKQITWSDSRWIVVVVGRSWRGDSYPRRAVLGSGATRESGSQCGRNAIAS